MSKIDDFLSNAKNETFEVDGSTVEVPAGEWIHVPLGKILAMDTYLDDDNVLRSSTDHSCVVWHQHRTVIGDDGEPHRVSCDRRGIQPEEIKYDPDTGAPWCPDCYEFRPKKGDL